MNYILLDQYVTVHVNSKNKEYFKSKGYKCGKNGSKILVKVSDLKPYSRAKIKVQCDFCNKIYVVTYSDYNNTKYKEYICCSNGSCQAQKRKLICQIEHGVDNWSSLPEVRKKVEDTNIEKYGCKCTLQNEEVRKKQKETCLKKYGVEYAIGSDDVQKKIRKTLNDRYGVYTPTQSEEFLSKSIQSKYINGNQTSSKNQRFICDCLDGKLNYPFKRYFIDVAFPDKKIALEYNGSGHDLSVKMGHITKKEFDRNENFRRKQLFLDDWKILEIISKKDKRIKKETILNIFDFCCNLFDNHNKHYIKVYIDDDKIMSGNDKICYKDTLND